jgi:hypothetical protein
MYIRSSSMDESAGMNGWPGFLGGRHGGGRGWGKVKGRGRGWGKVRGRGEEVWEGAGGIMHAIWHFTFITFHKLEKMFIRKTN